MRLVVLLFTTLLLISCSGTSELPTAGTMETGDTVRTPKQYHEFCERDKNNICPETEGASSNN